MILHTQSGASGQFSRFQWSTLVRMYTRLSFKYSSKNCVIKTKHATDNAVNWCWVNLFNAKQANNFPWCTSYEWLFFSYWKKQHTSRRLCCIHIRKSFTVYLFQFILAFFFLLIFWFESEIIVHIELFPINNDFYELVCNKWKSDTFTMELWTELIYFVLINTGFFSGEPFMPNFSWISPKILYPKYKHQWIMRWSRLISNWIYQNVIT